MKDQRIINWLLEEGQPSVRYYTLVDILGRKANDPEVREAYSSIPRKGWAKDILALQQPGGYWEPNEPKDPTPENVLRWPANFLRWLDFPYEILRDKRQSDGAWLLDKVHPDFGPGAQGVPDPRKVKPFVLEKSGKPSKWITLTALRVLKRVENAS